MPRPGLRESVAESGSPPIKLEAIGAGLPEGFLYLEGSSFGVTTADPQIDEDRCIWELGSPKPEVSYGESVTQTFTMEGAGVPEGYYSWVEASREDVGTVSSCVGYSILSQAGGTTIEADVVRNEGSVFPASWKVN